MKAHIVVLLSEPIGILMACMEQRFTLLTLGVDDLVKSTRFFERLGWQRSVRQVKGVAFFQCGCCALALYPRSDLAKDAGVSPLGNGFGGIAIAYNTRSKEEVDVVLAEAKSAGGEIVKAAKEASWGWVFRILSGS